MDVYKKMRKSAKEKHKQIVRDNIKARLYCMSYGNFKAERDIVEHNKSIREAHEKWKRKTGWFDDSVKCYKGR